ncbi:DUF1905 domain-containing protein [Parahaliea mediterranea]|uniref:DUF1905 domain-containing protein n=1 Tax=Parahaliea mediterranea TaxID=651086 RepID=UPI000E2E713C|nr:YdeI/OmpD-associated family protein [Parahaliea mediterranea]
MPKNQPPSQCDAVLQRPLNPDDASGWTFLVLPRAVSDTLPRRGRTSVEGTLNGQPFTAQLEPDGNKSHWLRVDDALRKAAGAEVGDAVALTIQPVKKEPEPDVPADLAQALAATPAAHTTWHATTTLARVDWIHWITSAKQATTRHKRVNDACDMLASGKKRVCCFDTSGFYSKALGAPIAEG